jgi:membrane protein
MVSLFRKTADEWTQDRCPQPGAALAYYTIFSLAPMVLVLLAVFGLIYGGSEQAREKVTDQLPYFLDPNGVKVFQDIAANAAEPKGAFWQPHSESLLLYSARAAFSVNFSMPLIRFGELSPNQTEGFGASCELDSCHSRW